MDGGFALTSSGGRDREFRILHAKRSPEYGRHRGATTSVVTPAWGATRYHGSLYEFVRNDAFDARNFFSAEVEPLNQNQFGATIGGPVLKDRLFFFGYYEGFRNKQGQTTTATVPTAKERQGDFSEMGRPLLNLAAGGVQFPNNQLPPGAINPVARNVANLYPLGNISPSIYRATLVGKNVLDQTGGRVDFKPRPRTGVRPPSTRAATTSIRSRCAAPMCQGTRRATTSRRTARFVGHAHPLTRDDQLVRLTFLKYDFFFDQRLNKTPPQRPGLRIPVVERDRRGPPFFNVSGYTRWRRDHGTAQLETEHLRGAGQPVVEPGLAPDEGGVEYLHTGIDMFQAIAPNAFYVFAGTFPTNNAVANLLLGATGAFYQGSAISPVAVRVNNLGSTPRTSGGSAAR